jgi:hypothetical protein
MGVIGVLALWFTANAVCDAEAQEHVRPRLLWLLAFLWAFVPALWAWAEFFFIHPRWGNDNSAELLKEGHRLSLAVWAPIALSLAAYSSSDYFKPLSPNPAVQGTPAASVVSSSQDKGK